MCIRDRLGSNFVPRHDDGNIVAIKADMLGEEMPVCNVLMGGLHRPWMPCRGEGNIGNVKAGEHALHSIHCLGGRGIHTFDHAVGDAAMENLCHQHVIFKKISRILGPVSYTHLDVDKRQMYASVALGCIGMGLFAFSSVYFVNSIVRSSETVRALSLIHISALAVQLVLKGVHMSDTFGIQLAHNFFHKGRVVLQYAPVFILICLLYTSI